MPRSALSLRAVPAAAVLVLFVVFAVAAPGFLTLANLLGILGNSFALLAIVAIAMTLAVSAGGIDLAVGTAVDLASLVFVALVAAHAGMPVALAGGMAAALATGAFNATLIAGLRITPFLATLDTLFIGQSIQQLSTGGGQPIYLITGRMPVLFTFLGHGRALGLPVTLLAALLCAATFAAILGMTGFGRRLVAIGLQPAVAWHSGLRVRRDVARAYLLGSLCCGVGGILLSCTVNAYVPLSGNGYLLNAIGATFIGTTLSTAGRASVTGTLVGVLLLNIVANGLLLIGWNYYWQQVGTGLLIFLVLAASFSARHRLRPA
jgi:ribose transport system permease protein